MDTAAREDLAQRSGQQATGTASLDHQVRVVQRAVRGSVEQPDPELAAAVPFYGRQPKAEDVPRIKAPLLLHYAELDKPITEGWPAYEAALKAAGKTYEAHVYPGVNHGFHNDSTPRYDEAAAKLAWERTIAWFNRYLA